MDPFYASHPRFQTPSPLLWRHYTSWVPPPKNSSFINCWTTCHPSWLPLPTPSIHGLDLLDTHSSLLVHFVVVSRGRKQASVSAKFGVPSTSYSFVTSSRPGILCNTNCSNASHKIYPKSTLTQLPRILMHAHHPSQQVSPSKIQAKFILQHRLFKEDQPMMFQAKMSPQRHLQAL